MPFFPLSFALLETFPFLIHLRRCNSNGIMRLFIHIPYSNKMTWMMVGERESVC